MLRNSRAPMPLLLKACLITALVLTGAFLVTVALPTAGVTALEVPVKALAVLLGFAWLAALQVHLVIAMEARRVAAIIDLRAEMEVRLQQVRADIADRIARAEARSATTCGEGHAMTLHAVRSGFEELTAAIGPYGDEIRTQTLLSAITPPPPPKPDYSNVRTLRDWANGG